MSRAAVFLDKDGTIIEDVPYCVDPAQMRLMPGAIEGLGRLASVGYQLVVVSNQPGVALGYFPATALAPVERRLGEMLRESGIELAGFYFCPHHPEGKVSRYVDRCGCRKPAPGLILNAARDLSIELARSWMVGDILHDIEAGRLAGCRTVLIDNGNETDWRLSRSRSPDVLASDLAEAAERIIEEDAGC
jgi:D-glycero-D-manno-heptose 1,7-bisphosphate phosphatase